MFGEKGGTEMNKLEFKHWIPHLPYGLQVLTGDGVGKIIGVPDILTSGDVINVHFGANLKRKKFDFGFGGSEYNKPSNFGYYYINNVILQNIFDKNDVLDFSDSRAIPMLRPLPDLIKPCLTEGKIPIVEMAKIEGFTPTPYTIEDQNGTFVLYGDWFCHPMEHIEKEYPKARFFFKIDTDNFGIDRGLEYNDELVDSVFRPCSNQLALFEWLFEHHFDVHNLIEQGLAIDINTLQI